MTRSSEVVMRLNGCDATDGMFDLVFSRPQGDPIIHTDDRCIPSLFSCIYGCMHEVTHWLQCH